MDINLVMKEVQKNKKIFHSEAELQFEIAYVIRKLFKDKNVEVWVEYRATKLKNFPDYIGVAENRTPTIDLVVKLEKKLYPIEVKYITSKFEWGSYKLNDGNGTDKAFFYATDIRRIEAFKECYTDSFHEGYAIIVSNNESWKSSKCKIPNNTFDYETFYLEDNLTNTLSGFVRYKNPTSNPKDSDLKKKLTLSSSYPTKWDIYSSQVGNGSATTEFNMIVTTIK